jgi:integrase
MKVSKKTPHMVTKGGRFYFRMRVPVELVAHVGKAEISQALGDVAKAQAEVSARQLAGQWAEHFLDERRRLGFASSPPAQPLRAAIPRRLATPEEVAHLAEASARKLLALDEEFRIDGTRTEGANAWLSSLSDLEHDVTDMLANGAVGGTQARLLADLAPHALTLPEDHMEARRLVRTWTAAQARALKAIDARSRGIPVPTPAPVRLPESLRHPNSASLAPCKKTAEQLKLRDALELWKTNERTRPLKTIQKATQAVTHFEAVTGNPSLGRITKAMGFEFRAALLSSAMSDKTASDRLSWVQVLLNFEASRYGRISANPWKGISVKVKRSPHREGWKDYDACKLFALPLFQRYELPADKNAGVDAAYWLPILGAFTGARITELAQLLVTDIQQDAAQWYIRFEVTERWQSLKREASRRTIPMHGELVRLGLPEYAKAMHEGGQSRLFPAVVVSDLNHAGGGPSKWFSSLKMAAGFGPANTFHGWRNTIETKLQQAREGQLYIDRYLGHRPQGSEGANHGLNPVDLVETAAKVAYEGLELPRVYSVAREGR